MLVRCQRDIGARDAEVGKAISSAVVNVIAMTSIFIVIIIYEGPQCGREGRDLRRTC